MRKGMCACMSGACSTAGKCGALPPGFVPPTTTPKPQPAQAAPASPQASAPAPAPSSGVGSWAPVTQLDTGASNDDFLKWHTGPSRLFTVDAAAHEQAVPREDLLTPALTLASAA